MLWFFLRTCIKMLTLSRSSPEKGLLLLRAPKFKTNQSLLLSTKTTCDTKFTIFQQQRSYCGMVELCIRFFACYLLHLHLHSDVQSRFALLHLHLAQSPLQEHLISSLHALDTSGSDIQTVFHDPAVSSSMVQA